MTTLGVNVDHIATIRQARQAPEPDPVAAAILAELAGAHGITVHLRGDRRHISDRDVRLLREVITTRLNLEMAVTEEMISLALEVGPDSATLVPEREGEVTTEGGLDVVKNEREIMGAVERLQEGGLEVSLFIDPERNQIEHAAITKVTMIEINTAAYSEAVPKGLKESDEKFQSELDKIVAAAQLAESLGLRVLAGHGLTYRNVRPISDIPQMTELNIGHNIVARAALVGMERAVREMLEAMTPRTTQG
ncbi:MAG: pyridoxine 5'-phosphate synthase [Acidobacteria bacterium]|nr:pyridoxine 5'-phosphate synthase [Acidobacteriota bacterium]